MNTTRNFSELSENIQDSYIKDFVFSIIPGGYRDIQAAVSILYDADIPFNDFLEYMDNYMQDCQVELKDLDIAGLAYEYVLGQARHDIEELTNVDILNEYDISVYGNYMCSSFDCSEETKQELEKIVSNISEDDITDTIKVLISEIS
jgi:hypothetical protein